MTDPFSVPNQVARRQSSSGFIRSLFYPPFFDDEERSQVARLLHIILVIMITATLFGYAAMIDHPDPRIVSAAITLVLLVELVSFILLHLKQESASAVVLTSGLWFLLIGLSAISEGLANAATFSLILVITIAGLALGRRAGLVFAGLSSLAVMGLMIGKANNLLPDGLIAFEPFSFWAIVTVSLMASAGMIQLATGGLKEATHRARENERLQREANRELQTVRADLEDLVQSRTQDLQNRSKNLQAAIEISRVASSMIDDEALMSESVELIRTQFDLYYVGLFLLDPAGEWAILRAGTGEAGQAMIARGHSIHYGSGMVGWSIANLQPRIAAEIGKDAVRLATPELPLTRSEAAFPLRARGSVIGALTVQSAIPEAFGETEISTFQTLADQIAIALENARLFSESRMAPRMPGKQPSR